MSPPKTTTNSSQDFTTSINFLSPQHSSLVILLTPNPTPSPQTHTHNPPVDHSVVVGPQNSCLLPPKDSPSNYFTVLLKAIQRFSLITELLPISERLPFPLIISLFLLKQKQLPTKTPAKHLAVFSDQLPPKIPSYCSFPYT